MNARSWVVVIAVVGALWLAASAGGCGAAGAGGDGGGGAGGDGTTTSAGGAGPGPACNDVCPGSELCDGALGCVACRTGADCAAPTPACVKGRCVDCGSNADCPMGQACFPAFHHCAPACKTSADCQTGSENLCDEATGACVTCLAATDCTAQLVCDPVLGECVECASDGDCNASAPHCSPTDHCVACLVDSQCPEGHVCKNPFCVSDGPCVSAADCKATPNTPICDNGNCVQCIADEDCPGFGQCLGGLCMGG